MTVLIEVKVADLAGEALNWAVGTAEGLNMYVAPTVYGVPARAFVNRLRGDTVYGQRYDPANDWATGGPLIEKYGIDLELLASDCWRAETELGNSAVAALPLIAICNAIVVERLGKVVSVPAELMP